jgi:hypothetical protein
VGEVWGYMGVTGKQNKTKQNKTKQKRLARY